MRRTFSILMAIVLGITISSAQGISGKKFYDQLGTTDFASWNSSLPMGFRTVTQLAADDFIITAGEQEITGCVFVYDKDYASSFSVKIYEDDAGWPGAEIESFEVSDLTIETTSMFVNAITALFPSAIVLAEGKYWLSIAATDISGKWYLNTDTDVIGAQGKIMRLADFYGNPISDPVWENDDYSDYQNLSFALLRNPDDHDFGLASIDNPKNGELSIDEQVTVSVVNLGVETQTTFDVFYQVSSTINGTLTEVAKFTESVSGVSIESGDTYNHTFTETVDMSTIDQEYSIKTTVILANDNDLLDNSKYKTVKNYGPVYYMGVDKEVISCDGIFVDNGGIDGAMTEASADTITFYPSTEGSRVSIDFTKLEIQMNEFKYFTFYDGVSTDANVLHRFTINELNSWNKAIVALNPEGAITLVTTLGNYFYEGNGWEANITCVTPNNIEFALTDFKVGDPTMFNVVGEPSNLKVVVLNKGGDTLSREVTLMVDNKFVATVVSDTLIPGGIDTVVYAWIPEYASESYGIKAILENDGQNTNNDNEIVVEGVVAYENGILLESFEGLELPLGWTSKTGTYEFFENDIYHGEYELKLYSGDTIITPMLKPVEGDVFSFTARPGGGYWDKNVQVLISENLSGPWDTIYTDNSLGLHEFNFDEYIDRIYYIAFTTYDWCTIDYIVGPKVYQSEFDLAAMAFVCPSIAKSETEVGLKLSFANVGTQNLMGSQYMFEIKTADSVYTEVKGVDIKAGEKLDINAFLSFNDIDTLDLYFEIVFEEDLVAENNMSTVKSLVLTENHITSNETIRTNGNVFKLGWTSSLSEMIYYPSDIKAHGELLAVEFNYEYNGADTFRFPLNVYLAEINDSLLLDAEGNGPAWIGLDSVDFVKLINDSIDAIPGKNSFVLPIDGGFKYTGTGNIVMLVHRDSSEWGSSMYIDMMACNEKRFANKYGDYVRYDLNAIDGGSISDSEIPNVTWHFNSEGTPEFVSEPTTMAYEFDAYSYDIEVAYADGPASYTIEAVQKPDWMNLDITSDTTATLSAANIAEVGAFPVQLKVTDGIFTATQTFEVEVYAVPVYTTEPDTAVIFGEAYSYEIAATLSGDAIIEYTVVDAPIWLTLTNNGDNTAILTGTPPIAGEFEVAISANGPGATTTQSFKVYADYIPTIEAIDDVTIEQDVDFEYTIQTSYEGERALEIVAGANYPTWLMLTDNGDGTATLFGAPLEIGVDTVDIIVANGLYQSVESFVLTICDVPNITSAAVEAAEIGVEYTYSVATEYNGEMLMLSADAPEWLTFVDNTDGSATLTGTPTERGVFAVTILAEGDCFLTTQTFAISVGGVSIDDKNAFELNIYPNPANEVVNISTNGLANVVTIYSHSGQIIYKQELNPDSISINLNEFEPGFYLVEVGSDNNKQYRKLIVN